MKYAKILLGIVIILAGISESLDAYRQVSGFDIGILAAFIVVAVISFLLIRSGIKTGKKHGHTKTIYSFLWILVYCFFIIVGLGLIVQAIGNYKKPIYYMTVSDGTKIPLDYCINGSKKGKDDFKEVKEQCECLIGKLYETYKHDPDKINTIKTGIGLDLLLRSMSQEDLIKYNFFDCYNNSSKNNWSQTLEKRVINSLKQGLKNTEFEDYYDIDIYCDCVVEYLKTKEVKEVFTDYFFGSEEFTRIDSICKLNSEY